MPLLSIVMSVLNGERSVACSITSILSQSYTDFEFIIFNDASKDKTAQILHSFAKEDRRIRVVSNVVRRGLAINLAHGCSGAKGVLIGRQDADDLSLPGRLEKQVLEFQKNPKLVLLGTESIETRCGISYRKKVVSNIPLELFNQNPIPHTSAMFKKDAYIAAGGYDVSLRSSQDLDLWFRLCKIGEIKCIQEPFVVRSIHPGCLSRRKRILQCYDTAKIRWRYRRLQGNCSRLKIINSLFYQLAAAFIPFGLMKWKRRVLGGNYTPIRGEDFAIRT